MKGQYGQSWRVVSSSHTQSHHILTSDKDKLHNCDVMIREDITTDEFIDVLIGTRKYIPCLCEHSFILLERCRNRS
jgi:ribosome-interacting GTPase 1